MIAKKWLRRIGFMVGGVCMLWVLCGCAPADVAESSTRADMATMALEATEEQGTLELPESSAAVETTATSQEEGYETLTLDIVRALAEKHEDLTLEDLSPYLDIRAVTVRKDRMYEQVEFEDNGVEYVLRVIASAKSESDENSQELDAVILFTKEYETDTSKAAQKLLHSGDIRSSNIDHIINATVTMEDYLTVTLPEGVQQDRFEAGEYMGTRLLMKVEGSEKAEQVGMFRIETAVYSWREETVKEYESLSLGDAVMRRELIQLESGSRMYRATITKENAGVVYRLALEEEYFSEEDFLTMTESVTMGEHAFY